VRSQGISVPAIAAMLITGNGLSRTSCAVSRGASTQASAIAIQS
jgi:hypothetical protein